MGIYFVYILIRYSKIELEGKVFFFLLFTALGVYSVDANLNFPIARPQVLVMDFNYGINSSLLSKISLSEKKVNS